MLVVFNSTGELPNEIGKNWENREFKHTTSITVTPDILETEVSREFSIVGFLPNKLTIDNNGIINGIFDMLENQDGNVPLTQLKPIGIDGTNWNNDGSASVPLHYFYFKIKVTITYTNDDPLYLGTNPIVEDFISDEVCIKIIKNNNLLNTRFAIRYMKAGYKLSAGNDEYGLENINEYLSLNSNSFEIIK